MSDTINQKNNNVTNGSIVGGDLIIHQAISPEAILEPILNILTHIRHRDPTAAQKTLITLFSASQLDNKTKGVLDVLAILVDIAKNSLPENAYSKITNFLNICTESIWQDIATSTLMRLDIHSGRPDDAESRYSRIEFPADFCQEVYFEFLADKNVLEDFYKKYAVQLSEPALCGLARGFLRCESFDSAISSSARLNSIYPSFNSLVVQHVIKCFNLNKKVNHNHFWLTSNSDRKEIIALADETATLIEQCNGNDYCVVGQAYAFLLFLYGNHKKLLDACWRNITNIEAVNEDFSRNLRAIMENGFDEGEGIIFDIKKSENDFSYRKSLVQRLSESDSLSTDEAILFGRIADSKTIRQWVRRGGLVATKDDLERDFITIELKCFAHDKGRNSKDEIAESVEKFLTQHQRSLQDLNPQKLFDLTTKLIEIKLAHQAIALLQPIIPKMDLWPSPIIKNYVRALLECDQLATLRNVVSEISQNDWDAYIWQIKARQLDLVDDKSAAIAAIESALELEPLSLECWHHWLFLNRNLKIEEYSALLDKIPDDIFIHKFRSQLAWQILFEFSMAGKFSRVENIVVNWFIQNPDACAKELSNFQLSRSFAGNDNSVDPVSAATEHCLGGYHFTINGQSHFKLIVQGVDRSHSCILDATSKHGSILLELNVGESVQNGMQEIKLLEVLPPYVAAFRLSIELRQANNDGDDCFYSFTLPENPEEMILELGKKIQASDDSNKMQLICENPQIPLFLKGHMLGNGCPVHSVLYHLTNKKTIKMPLPDFGEIQSKGIILDIYSVIYLGLTGLINGLINSKIEFTITAETRAYLVNFVRQVKKDDYMRIGVTDKGKLWRVTSEEVLPQLEGVLHSINHILEHAKNVSPNLVDMPPSIIQIEDALDGSTYSSLRLSIANDLPWLCIDKMFAQLSFQSGYRVINARDFFSKIGTRIEIRKKLSGLFYHASSGLPYPLTYEEIAQLASLEDESAHYYLAEILYMYPNAYENLNSAVDHLSKIVIMVLIKAYVKGEILNGLRVDNPNNNGYAERVFNVCCFLSLQVKDGLSAERKLAYLLYTILERISESDDLNKLVRMLGSSFVLGHFLNINEVNIGIRDCRLKNSL